jgi:hypothetical protein
MAKTSASRARSRVLASDDASIKKYVLKIEIIVCNTPVRKKAAFASKTEIVFCKQGCPNPNKARNSFSKTTSGICQESSGKFRLRGCS